MRATDRAGNVGAWSASKCTAVASDDRALIASKGWVRAKATGWIAGTYTSAARTGLTLTTAKAQKVRQVGVIATRCPSCGAVAVFVGKIKVGTISLYGRTTTARTVVALPRLTATRSGVVRLVSTSNGKTLRIDGLAVTAW